MKRSSAIRPVGQFGPAGFCYDHTKFRMSSVKLRKVAVFYLVEYSRNMIRLFLTSSVNRVATTIEKSLPESTGRKLVFVTTASELYTDDLEWRDSDRKALVEAGFAVTDYTITGKSKEEIKKYLEQFDILYMEGGNTYYLLEQIQKTNCAEIICALVKKGIPYIGCSAGSIVAGPDIYPIRHTDEVKEFRHLENYRGLGLVNFIVLPHWGQECLQELYLGKRMKFNYNEDHKLLFLTDNQYIYIQDEWMKFIDIRIDR
jgi:dipeptidase E